MPTCATCLPETRADKARRCAAETIPAELPAILPPVRRRRGVVVPTQRLRCRGPKVPCSLTLGLVLLRNRRPHKPFGRKRRKPHLYSARLSQG